jgi:YVTN family beta-propeller protein
VLRERSDSESWQYHEHPLAEGYTGTDITVYFGVLNDGSGGVTAMYVDDVSLPICSLEPTPVPTAITPAAHVRLPLVLRSYGDGGSSLTWSGNQGKTERIVASAPGTVLSSDALLRELWTAPAQADGAYAVSYSPVTQLLYAAVGEAVLVLNPGTGSTAAHIELGSPPRALAADVLANRVYATLPEANAMAVIDGQRQVLLDLVPAIPGASGVAVGRGRVYVTATTSDELVVVDKQNYAIMDRVAVGTAPYGVVCDRDRQRVYVGNAGDDTVYILDAGNAALLNVVHLGGLGHPHGLALDPVRERLYVTYARTPKCQAIAVIDTASGEIEYRLLGDQARPLFGAYGIAADPLLGRVYVTAGQEILTLGGEPLRVLSSARGVGPVYAFGMALKATEGRLYLADALQRQLVEFGKQYGESSERH